MANHSKDEPNITFTSGLSYKESLQQFDRVDIIHVDLADINDNIINTIKAIITLKKEFMIFSMYEPIGKHLTEIPEARKDHLKAIVNYGLIGLIDYQYQHDLVQMGMGLNTDINKAIETAIGIVIKQDGGKTIRVNTDLATELIKRSRLKFNTLYANVLSDQ